MPNIDTDLYPLTNSSLHLSSPHYKGPTQPHEQQCFAWVENCLPYFIFWINNTAHHIHVKKYKKVYREK